MLFLHSSADLTGSYCLVWRLFCARGSEPAQMSPSAEANHTNFEGPLWTLLQYSHIGLTVFLGWVGVGAGGQVGRVEGAGRFPQPFRADGLP